MDNNRLDHNKSSLLSQGFCRVWLIVGFVGHIIFFSRDVGGGREGEVFSQMWSFNPELFLVLCSFLMRGLVGFHFPVPV